MRFKTDRIGPALVILVLGATVSTAPAPQATVRLNADRNRIMAHGYDVVAYVTQQKPVRGSADIQYEWQGATWRFATVAHRDLFAKSSEHFAPQYGGFCAWAVSQGYTADVDPEAWSVVNGRLFLNYSKSVQRRWLQDRDANIDKGDKNWPALSRQR